DAVGALETTVLASEGLEGVVLRYGYFYGPGTSYASDGSIAAQVRARRFPIGGKGTARWSFMHLDDAARATIAAVEGGPPGAYNVVDDEPAPVSEWLPVYATALGAGRPRRVPLWLVRLVAGPYAVYGMSQVRGASNARARERLGWAPPLRGGRAAHARSRAVARRASSTDRQRQPRSPGARRAARARAPARQRPVLGAARRGRRAPPVGRRSRPVHSRLDDVVARAGADAAR